MGVNPTLIISIDRTELGLGPLVLSGSRDATPLGIVAYTEPAIQRRIRWAPDSDWVAGSEPLSSVPQQTLLSFSVVTDKAASETVSRALVAELRAAVGQWQPAVTVTVDDAPAETWACVSGDVSPASERTLTDLMNNNPVWTVTLPCHPARTIGA